MPAPITRRDFMRTVSAGVVAGTALGAYGAVSTGDLELVRKEIHLPGWDADGFRVAFLTDPHTTRPWSRDRAITAFQMRHAEKPDCLILGGDYLVGRGWFEDSFVNDLCGEIYVNAKYPVYAVLGNHDYAPGPVTTKRVVNAIRRNGIRLLINEVADCGGVVIAGFDDAIYGHHQPNTVPLPLGAKSILGVLHEPDYVDDIPTSVKFVLSGHSHGGQVRLPGGVLLYTPMGARTYIEGYYPDAKNPLYVSRGVGTVGADVRLFCRPEVTILTLRSA